MDHPIWKKRCDCQCSYVHEQNVEIETRGANCIASVYTNPIPVCEMCLTPCYGPLFYFSNVSNPNEWDDISKVTDDDS